MTYSSTTVYASRRNPVPGAEFRRGQNAIKFKPTVKSVGPIANTVILALILCIIGLIYLMQNSRTNNFGYVIQDLKDQKVELKRSNDELMVDSARLQSIEKVKSSQVAATLVNQPTAATIK